MGGGLLNIVAYGNQNVILTGNPTKTLFKCAYAKYTNFGLQKFRIDYDGQRTLHIDSGSHFSFKVPRYADLLMDTYLVVTLPTIWSPIVPPTVETNNSKESRWRPYEFKWIKHIGTQMIERVRFTIGGQTIQEYTGQYLHNLVERDFDASKKELYYKMTGHTPELNDPANAYGNINTYPNAYYTKETSEQGPEPSIRTRKLYIPLNIWFTLAAKMAFPLASLQYNELQIEVDLRPVRELFVIRNIPDGEDNKFSYYKKAISTEPLEQFYRFIHPPPSQNLKNNDDYKDTRTNWNADVHLISTYAFLTEDEVRVFAANSQTYLIKQAYSQTFHNITGPQKVKLETMGMVANWTWFFQRSDATLRNEWSNYTNWPYDVLPYGVVDPGLSANVHDNEKITLGGNTLFHPGTHGDGDPSSLLITGAYQVENEKNIMTSWGLLFDGKYRENILDAGVLNYVEKYARTSGNGPDGQYCYNFGLRTDPTDFQPTGAVNLSKFKDIEFEINVLPPKLADEANTLVVCNSDGDLVGINKSVWDLYEYTYELTVLEERYNVLSFTSGNASLMYAR
jgi:hypothetical protein